MVDGSFLSGTWIADIVLAAFLFEALALWLYRRRSGRGPDLAQLARLLLPGFFLVLALRVALAEGPWYLVGLCLALAGLAHAAEVRRLL